MKHIAKLAEAPQARNFENLAGFEGEFHVSRAVFVVCFSEFLTDTFQNWHSATFSWTPRSHQDRTSISGYQMNNTPPSCRIRQNEGGVLFIEISDFPIFSRLRRAV